MAKISFGRVREMETGLVHVDGAPGHDQVTLCGITDWLGCDPGKPTTAAVTCNPCRQIVDYCQGRRRLAQPRSTVTRHDDKEGAA